MLSDGHRRVARDLAQNDFVLSHFTLGRHHDIIQRVDAAAGAGCRAIGVSIEDYRRLEAGGSADRLTGLLDERNLCVAEIDALRTWADPVRADTADAIDQETAAFRIADRFECRSLHALGSRTATVGDSAEAFGALCDRAAEHGLLVALEFMPSTHVATAADAFRVVEAADRDNGVCASTSGTTSVAPTTSA